MRTWPPEEIDRKLEEWGPVRYHILAMLCEGMMVKEIRRHIRNKDGQPVSETWIFALLEPVWEFFALQGATPTEKRVFLREQVWDRIRRTIQITPSGKKALLPPIDDSKPPELRQDLIRVMIQDLMAWGHLPPAEMPMLFFPPPPPAK